MTKIPYQTSTQMLQKPIPVIASLYRKHTTFYKGENLANCIKIKPDSVKKKLFKIPSSWL
jgi:predicted transcriptional regulator